MSDMDGVSWERCSKCRPGKCPRPQLSVNHIDGPLILWCDGHIRWLTLLERVKLFFGKLDLWACPR